MQRLLYILFFILFAIKAYSQGEGVLSPLNPDFLKYRVAIEADKFINSSKDGFPLGYIPSPAKPDFTNYFKKKKKSKNDFPATYDLRTLGLLTSVKYQGDCGACWSFAALGAVESRWLMLKAGTFDLSEDNMNNCHHFEYASCMGGNALMATSYLARLSGPYTEKDDPYTAKANNCPSGLTPVSYVCDARFVPNDMDAIKQAIMDYGALYMAFYYSDEYYTKSNYTYYCPDASQFANHAVLLVGWNDTKQTAGGTGAWIIKNSWSSSWGEKGFGYISYNDKIALSENAYFPVKNDFYAASKLYYYDDLGWVRDWGNKNESAYALIKFTTVDNNPLTKVGTWVTASDCKIDIEIYDSFNGTSLGTMLSSLYGQTCPLPGYYTFDLPSKVLLTKGKDFFIKIKYYTPGYNQPVPVEMKMYGYSNPTIETGKCWLGTNGKNWTAIGTGTNIPYDLCIKAYTYNTCNPPKASITPADSINICAGETVSLLANSDPNTNFQWQKGINDIAGATNSNLTVSESGSYSVVITNKEGCAAVSNTVNISVFNVEAPSEITINCMDSVQLTPSLILPTGNYLILFEPVYKKYTNIALASFGGSVKTSFISGNLVYEKDQANSYNGCSPNGFNQDKLIGKIAMIDRGDCEFGFKALKAQEAGAKAVIIVDKQQSYSLVSPAAGSYGAQVKIPVIMITYKDGIYLKNILNTSGFAKVSLGFDSRSLSVHWSPADGLNSIDIPYPYAKPIKNTIYNFTVSNGICTAKGEINIKIKDLPEINLGKDTTICNDQTFILNAGNNDYLYKWNDNSENPELNINTSLLNLGDHIYSVTATNNKGCYTYDSIKINIIPVSYYKLDGTITYANSENTPITQLRLYLKDKESIVIDSVLSDSTGYFQFNNLRNGIYTISSNINKQWGGSNFEDALLLINNYLSRYKISDKIKRIASDVNSDNIINPLDALIINRRFIGSLENFKSGDWYFPPQKITIYLNNQNINLKTICFGDVNGDYKF
ncbi:MAG: hypothetical protein KA792_00005 [Bacteroidales bacterium]|nr:hypothetical protein [Bacteroidales bacterium]